MRSHHIIAVAAVIVVGVGVKIFLFSPRAEASLEAPTNAKIEIIQMQHDIKNLPVQKMHDMTFIYSDRD